MRKEVSEPTAILLRRMFRSPGSELRLRSPAADHQPRSLVAARFQHVALLGVPAAAAGIHAEPAHRGNTAAEIAQIRLPARREKSLLQERRGLLPFTLVQGSRGGHGTRRRTPIRL